MKNHFLIFAPESRVVRHHALGALSVCLLFALTVIGLLQVMRADATTRNADQLIAQSTRFYAADSNIQSLNNLRFDPCKKN